MKARFAARNVFRLSWRVGAALVERFTNTCMLNTNMNCVARCRAIALLLSCAIAGIAVANPQSHTGAAASDKPPAATRGAGDNAATLWRDIFPRIKDKNDSGLTQDDWDLITSIASGNPPPTQKQLERGRVAMAKLGPVLDDVVSTSKLRKCDFEHDYSQGFGMPLPELAPMRKAARILGARANLALADGDWDTYLDSAGASSNLSRQVAQSPVLISSLVSGAIGYYPMSSAQHLVDEGSLTPEKAAKLLEAMDPLRGDDPHGYSSAMNEEYTSLISSKMDGKQLASMMDDPQGNERLQKLSAEEIHKTALPLAGLYKESAACFLEPNKEAALKRWNAALATMDTLPRNSQALMRAIMPHAESLFNNFFTQQANTDALMATLQGIASGKLNAGALGVPAIWWSRAAAAARSLNDEQQAAVELLRLSSVPDDSPLLAIAIATLDACDTTVFECMRRAMACESKVVSFEKLTRDSTPLDLALVGGLRGAARMALAKSMLPKWNAEQSLGLICMAIAASNALTSDPTFTHALTSQSIAEEIAVAVGHFSIRRGVTDELRGKLDMAIATIPRSDAFGFRAAHKKLRAELAKNLRWNFRRTDDVTEELTKVLAQKSQPWLFAVDIVYFSSEKPSASPDGTLVDMDDIFTPDSVKELAAAWEARQIQVAKDNEIEDEQAESEQSFKMPKHQRVQKFLNKINPPTIRDIALDMNRVGDALGEIDTAAAKRRDTK
jgi:hypothetical protein